MMQAAAIQTADSTLSLDRNQKDPFWICLLTEYENTTTTFIVIVVRGELG